MANTMTADDFVATRSLAIVFIYHQTSNVSCTLLGNRIVYHSDVVEASPVSAARTKSSLST